MHQPLMLTKSSEFESVIND